jgi:deoxyribodipyrimidine photolyase-related protein
MAQEVGKRLGKREVLLRKVQACMKRIIYVAFDHLSRTRGALAGANKASDVIVLVESKRMATGRNWHQERLFFLISSARHFAKQLEAEGFEVRYLKAETTVSGLEQARKEFGPLPIISAEPSSFVQSRTLAEFGVEFVKNDFFLTSRADFQLWAERQKTFVMENFYRAQRVRLSILVSNGEPEGGQWNFDEANRLPPPKNHAWPEPLEHSRDEIDLQVAAELEMQATTTWATTRDGALKQLEHFIKNGLDEFGPYEDAVAGESWAMNHSLLSPYLNNALISPEEVIDAVLTAYAKGNARIESVEAIVRQIIGWREYINGMYWFLGEDYRELNSLEANRKLLPVFTNPSNSKMNCVKSVVEDVDKRAWTHHIPRLMILSNLALITSTNPQQFLDWMRERFIDATEWVMVPNVIGMAVHADHGVLMTKPYAAGGAYISRMTNYCKGCAYDPKTRSAEDSCPFTTLYWDFLDRHRETFSKNHRMSQQLGGLNRLSDLPELRIRAKKVLEKLDAGLI